MTAPRLELRGVNVRYGAALAVRDVDLAVADGDFFVLVGPNGAGKSSLLRTIAGLQHPSAGEVLLDGEPIHRRPARDVARRGVVFMPEGGGIFPGLTVGENLELSARAGSDGAGPGTALECFPILAERLGQRAGSLSGGEQRMLALGCAMIRRPRLLMLDEMSLGLAPQVIGLLENVLVEMHRAGVTVVLVEQFVHRALALATRVAVLSRGSVVFDGGADELARSDQLMAAYLGTATAGV